MSSRYSQLHAVPLTERERVGISLYELPVDPYVPVTDTFRLGMRWGELSGKKDGQEHPSLAARKHLLDAVRLTFAFVAVFTCGVVAGVVLCRPVS